MASEEFCGYALFFFRLMPKRNRSTLICLIGISKRLIIANAAKDIMRYFTITIVVIPTTKKATATITVS